MLDLKSSEFRPVGFNINNNNKTIDPFICNGHPKSKVFCALLTAPI